MSARDSTVPLESGGARRGPIARLPRVPFDPVTIPALVLVGVLVVVGATQSDSFLSSFNISNVLIQVTALLLVSLGQMFVVSSGGLDLAVGATTSLVTVVIASLAGDVGIVAAIAAGAGAGLAVGLLNGLAVAWGLDSFLTTLATFSLAQGVALLIMETAGGSVPDGLGDLAGFFGGPTGVVPVALPLVLAVALAATVILRRSRLGTEILAVGSNREVAALCGARVRRALVSAYTLSALACVLAGIFLTARTLGGDPLAGSSLTLDSLAVVVLGGCVLGGGRATVLGTVVAAFALGLLSNVMNLMEFADYWQTPVKGMVVILAVLIPSLALILGTWQRRRTAVRRWGTEP